jgi:endonuclease/exonuclease/phosphatase family metal-dependent hydrolase
MKNDPLLEKLDWVFISTPWTMTSLDTKVVPLSRPISDHIPFVVQISTQIPKS